MPERIEATRRITEHLLGGPVIWNGLTGEIREGQSRTLDVAPACFAPREAVGITQEVWDTTWRDAEKLFEKLVHSIDWARVLITAMAIHEYQDDDHKDWEINPDSDLCPSCVVEALLTKER